VISCFGRNSVSCA